MRVSSKGQVTIPLNTRKNMGVFPAETEVDFLQDKNGCWYIAKTKDSEKNQPVQKRPKMEN